jgi:asparagine synthase (glutamine-hydrolysing)
MAAHELAQRGERLTALTWVPKRGIHVMPHRTRITDERHHAGAVAAQHPNIDHVLVQAQDAYPLSILSTFTDALGQPFLTPVRLPTFRATGDRLAELGCRVLLMGQHGNMTISYDGLTLLPTLLRRGRWLRGIRETAALARAPSWSPRRALYTALRPVLPGASIVHEIRRRRRVSGNPPLAPYPIHPALAARYDVAGRAKELGYTDVAGAEHDAWSFRMRTIRRFDSGILFKGMQAALGFEIRDPTIDMRIVEYCLSIPEDQFLRAGRSRWLIRRAMRDLVAPAVLEEHRRGMQEADWPRFIAPHREAFVTDLREIAASPVAREIVDVQGLGRLLEEWPSEWNISNIHAYMMMLPLGVAMGRFVLGYC